jgi:hypothetical protein
MASSRQPKQGHVRFSTAIPCENYLPSNNQLNEEIWWQADDYKRFCNAALLLVQAIRCDADLLDCIARAYKVAGLLASLRWSVLIMV